MIAELDAERHRAEGLEQEQHATRDEKLIDRRLVEHRPDDEIVEERAATGDERNAEQEREGQREAGDLEEIEDRVHADHDEFGVADPHDIDDAEYEIEAERQQGEQSGQQHAVDQRLDKEDVERAIETRQATQTFTSPLAPAAAPVALESRLRQMP